MEEEDSRLFPLPIVHRALNIFTSVLLEYLARRSLSGGPYRPYTILLPPTKLTSSVWPVPYACHTVTMGRGKR